MKANLGHALLLRVMGVLSVLLSLLPPFCGFWAAGERHISCSDMSPLTPTSSLPPWLWNASYFFTRSSHTCMHTGKDRGSLAVLLLNALGFVQPFMLFWSKMRGFGIHPVYITQATQDYMDLSSSLLNTALSHRHMLTQVINEGF